MTPKLKVFLGGLLLSLPLDIATKQWVVSSLAYGDRVAVVDGFFFLTHVRNPGAAFSMFATAPEPFRKWFFLIATSVAIVLIFSFFRSLTPGDRLSAGALGLILGGAAGNLLDRLRYGEVIDFLHFRLWSGYSWPDFNVADTAIVIGVALLILELIATESAQRGAPSGSEEDQTTSASAGEHPAP
ncbi:MAG: signal peptidase II [Deltaproteobacteria bacterium]|jgi:signal peptidase II|nr:signal peptidase II [Deltaproteobacteria bacterium]